MGRLGVPELLLILAIVLIFFGPQKLPGLASSLGQAVRGFKRAMNGDDEQPAAKPLPAPQKTQQPPQA